MTPTTRKNAALVRGFLTDVVDGGDTAAASVFLAPNVVDHHLVFGTGPDDEVVGLGWRVLAAADVAVDVDDVVATADRAGVRGTVRGTHRESLMDLAPTGASFEIPYAWFFRLDDGLIAEIWSLPDGLGLMRQLDALPDPASTGPTTDVTDYHYP